MGFHLLGQGDHQYDSMPWHLGSIGMAVLTNALHSVRHHQLAPASSDFGTAEIAGRTNDAIGLEPPMTESRPRIRR
jgi:hypothetical protein